MPRILECPPIRVKQFFQKYTNIMHYLALSNKLLKFFLSIFSVEPLPTRYYFKHPKYKPKRMCSVSDSTTLFVDEALRVHLLDTTTEPWQHIRHIKVKPHFNAGVSGVCCVPIPSGRYIILYYYIPHRRS